jgi:hypothetical protein
MPGDECQLQYMTIVQVNTVKSSDPLYESCGSIRWKISAIEDTRVNSHNQTPGSQAMRRGRR